MPLPGGGRSGTYSALPSLYGGYQTTASPTTVGNVGPSRRLTQPPAAPGNPKIETLTDDFTAVDGAKWTYNAGASVTGGQLVETVNASYSGQINGLDRYDLTGSSATIELVQRPNVGNGTTQAYFFLTPDVNTNYAARVLVEGANIVFGYRIGGVDTSLASIAYSATAHRWLRISESGGTVTWWTSPDGTTWTSRATWLATLPLTALATIIGTGYYGTETTPGSAIWDNLNLTPTLPPQGSGTGAWSFAGTGTGAATPKGASTGSWSFTGSGSGKRTPKASGSGSWSFTGSGAGKRTPKATGSGAWSFTGAGSGVRTPKASGSGSWTFTGTGTGTTARRGTGSGTNTWVGTGAGKRTPKASGLGSWSFIGTGTGATVRRGTGTGLAVWTGTGTGTAPLVGVKTGSGSGSWTFVGTGTGRRAPKGVGTGLAAWVGTGAGITPAATDYHPHIPGTAVLTSNGVSTATLTANAGTATLAAQTYATAVASPFELATAALTTATSTATLTSNGVSTATLTDAPALAELQLV